MADIPSQQDVSKTDRILVRSPPFHLYFVKRGLVTGSKFCSNTGELAIKFLWSVSDICLSLHLLTTGSGSMTGSISPLIIRVSFFWQNINICVPTDRLSLCAKRLEIRIREQCQFLCHISQCHDKMLAWIPIKKWRREKMCSECNDFSGRTLHLSPTRANNLQTI